ncbi:MAG: ribonuclease Z [Thermoplasmata archaeon]|jgi:ribonuclease Z|nr:ribonuclease Z [Thermoplasmatales archaeon]PMP73901.1 MAG: ribonuclease Z [Aciduliprofundum sp.]HEU13060.1 ribonuclease Z [Euryarchaeota archaeon]
MISTIKIVFFGTSGSWPSVERGLPSLGIQVDRDVLLFDIGEGTQRQIMQTTVSFMKISKIFITHFHGDHFLGLAGLIQTMVLNGRTEPLEIYGPADTIKQVSNFLQLGYYSLSFNITIRELRDSDEIDFGDYIIKTTKTSHPVTNLAYCFKEKDRKRISQELMEKYSLNSKDVDRIVRNGSIEKGGRRITLDDISDGIRVGRKIVYTGDTSPCDCIVELARDAHVLIHDSTVDSSLEEKANEYGHSSARQAAMIAKNANVKYLFLTHISPRYRINDIRTLEDEARRIFKDSTVARDLMEFTVTI